MDMDNFQIIKAIEQIVHPYFVFNLADFYGDRGSCEYPAIESLDVLFFKYNWKNAKGHLSNNQQNELAEQVKALGVGEVELAKVMAFGRYLIVRPSSKK